MKADVFIPSSLKDANKLATLLIQLVSCCNDINDIYVSIPSINDRKEFELCGHKVKFFNDSEILDLKWLSLCNFRKNWIYQQLLKLCQNVTKTEYYFVIDADIFPLKPFNLFVDEKPILFIKPNGLDESAFIRYISKATGGDLATWTENEYATTSYISDFMLFKKSWVNEMILKYFNSIDEFLLFSTTITFWRNIPGIRRKSIFMSEYEMYGRYVAKYHSNEVYRQHIIQNYEPAIQMKMVQKGTKSQSEQAYSVEDIQNYITQYSKQEEYKFIKLQTNCPYSDVKYKKIETNK